jgi:hypothetical protein
MPRVRTTISVDAELLREAEAAARELGLTRSAMWSLAMTQFLDRRRSRATPDRTRNDGGQLPEEGQSQ